MKIENGKWKKYRLGELFSIKQGFAFKSEKYLRKSPYRLCTLGNIDESNCFKFNDAKANYYSDDFPKDFVLNEGDLIIPLTEQTMGLFGNSAFIPKTYDYKFVLNQRVGKILYNASLIDKYYLHYLLATNNVRKQIEATATGTTQRNTSPDKISIVEVLIPNIDIQIKIGNFLYDIESKIALNRRMNAKLEQMAKRLYDYWFVQFDFPNADGKPYKSSGGKMEYNEALKREIPAGWEVKSIFDACDLLYGFPYATEPFDEDDLTASKKPYKIVRIRDIQNNSYSAKTTEKVDDKYRTRINDLLIGMDGYFHMNFWSRNDDYINQRIVRLRKTCISTLILYFQIMPFIKFKEEKAKGSTVGHLSDKDLKQLFVLIPNDKSLSNHFETILNMTTKTNAEIEKLTALRDRLLPLLMNGQVEVK